MVNTDFWASGSANEEGTGAGLGKETSAVSKPLEDVVQPSASICAVLTKLPRWALNSMDHKCPGLEILQPQHPP